MDLSSYAITQRLLDVSLVRC